MKPGPRPTTQRGTVAGKKRTIRLSPAEDAAAVAEARRFGLTVAEWFRSLIPMPGPDAVRSCADCKHYTATAMWTCPDAAVSWASEHDIPATDAPWPDTAPPCPAKESA